MNTPGSFASRGALAGAMAGLITACGDFGASWLWLPWWKDCIALFGRLVATQVPVGALLGASLGLFVGLGTPWTMQWATRWSDNEDRIARLDRRLWPLPYVTLAVPPLAWIAHLLLSGGKASQVPFRSLWVVVMALGLASAVYLVLRAARTLVQKVPQWPSRQVHIVAIGLLGVHLGLTKIDQHVYPKLYEYLHALLSVAAWFTAALAVLIVVLHRERRLTSRRNKAASAVWYAGIAAIVLGANLATLGSNPNVRVALFDHRAATSRSLMQGLETFLDSSSGRQDSQAAIASAQRARTERQQQAAFDDLPSYADAHLLLITIDALRADRLGHYGYERPVSPELDALAEQSIVFEQAYAQAPHSSYSLSSLLVSEYLHETVDIGQPLPDETLATVAAAHDYYTAAFFTLGIFHTEGERMADYRETAYGFERREHADLMAQAKTEQVLAEVDRVLVNGEQSSLFWVHYFDVHEPYLDTRFGTSDSDRYDSEIHIVDREAARLIRTMRERFSRPVIVAITADHGEEFRDHGGVYHGSTLYEEQIRVPLIVSVPGLPARRVTVPVETIDVAPTLLELAAMPVPSSMRGDDLRPLIVGREYEVGPAFASVMNKHMVVHWPYKLIADLRFNLFELYDLEADPRERQNLARHEGELLESMKGEVYAWLDSLHAESVETNPVELALRRGRLGDRRAVEALNAIVGDETLSVDRRREAARILGTLADRASADALVRGLSSPEHLVVAESAIALGRMFDERARPFLHELVYSEDPDLRSRAAVSLGRLRDPAAVPGLIEALWISEERYEREEAVRWLGRLRDPHAVEPLLQLTTDVRLRYLTVIALGQIGDERAYGPLVEMLEWSRHASVRDNLARALGEMGNVDAIPHLIDLAVQEPDLKNVGESLVRLDAIGRESIGGTDVGPAMRGRGGFGNCTEGPLFHDWNYRHRTWCETQRLPTRLPLRVPRRLRESESSALVLLRLRRIDSGYSTPVRLSIGSVDLPEMEADGQWSEHRFHIGRDVLRRASVIATLEAEHPGVRLAVDHMLLIPQSPTVTADTTGAVTEIIR